MRKKIADFLENPTKKLPKSEHVETCKLLKNRMNKNREGIMEETSKIGTRNDGGLFQIISRPVKEEPKMKK